MDGIAIPAEQVVPIEHIAPGVTGLRITFVNVFAVRHNDGNWVLIDAGLPGSAPLIHHWADKYFGKPPLAIVLTHAHFDHAGAAKALAETWHAPIYAHALEVPYLSGKESYAPPNVAAGGGIMPLLSPIYPRHPIDVRDHLRVLPSGGMSSLDELPELPGWQVVHTPGHTPGHVSFFRENDRTLLVGDAFCTTKPESFFEAAVLQHPELHGPPAYFTPDWTSACKSVQALAALEPRTVAPGHGKPLSGNDVAGELKQLAARFVELAIPENRRS